MPSHEGQAEHEEAPSAAAGAAFGETSNPAEYVPREATENALRTLEREVRAGHSAGIIGAPGAGKSLLLRLLASRIDKAFDCVFLPYGAFDTTDLCAWSLAQVGEDAGEDPRASLLRFVRCLAEDERSLVLLVDDAGSMRLETARELAELAHESGSRICFVLAASDDEESTDLISALHPDIAIVNCGEPMTRAETRLYVQTRLEQSGVREALRNRFCDDAMAWIHQLSGGVPRRIHDLAAGLLEDSPDGVGSPWQQARWIDPPDEAQLADLPPLPEILAKRARAPLAEDDDEGAGLG